MAERQYIGVCPECGAEIDGILPVPYTYGMEEAADMLEMTNEALRSWIYKNKAGLGEPLYRLDKHHRRHRYLRGWEIRYIFKKRAYKLMGNI